MAGSIDLGLLRRMMTRLRHRGPDGISFWSAGPVGLAHAAMHTTPEAELESQPHTDELGWYRLTFDGRLDHRKELRRQLESQGQRVREDTDAELVLCAYAAWGEQCAERMLGDYAFAIWDSRRRQLFCTRDIIGLRPFFYSLTSTHFLFASEPRAILESSDVSREPNEAAVAAHLAGNFQSNEETLYQGILRLPPAHSITVSSRAIRTQRYWAPDPNKTVRHPSDGAYAEHFLNLLRDVVSDRLRANRPVGVLLSGGLDSSSIASMALDHLRGQGRSPRALETFSTVFPEQACDESAYLREMEELWNHTSNLVPISPAEGQHFAAQSVRDLDFPGYPNGDLIFGPLKALARSKGIRVLLTGQGGDEWLTGSFWHYADYLKQGQFGNLIRQSRADRWIASKDPRVAAVAVPSFPILRFGIWPIVPPKSRLIIKKLLGRNTHNFPDFISDPLLQKMQASDPQRGDRAPTLQFPTLAQQQISRFLNLPWNVHAFEILERNASHYEMEMRDPFQDRRIVEFALALPEDQRWRGPWTKFILREAMRGRIPESIRTRTTKAEFSITLMMGLLELEAIGIFESMKLAERGWVKADRLTAKWREVKQLYSAGNDEYTKHHWQVWMAVGLELWARTLDRNVPRS